MNMKKTCKRFLRLGRGAEGFTLVELIVVIAILAILAGVAVPVYSTYVEQANKQADMTLISEIEDALTLAFYSGKLPEGSAGYILLSPVGTVENMIADAPDMEWVVSSDYDANGNYTPLLSDALRMTFGDNWASMMQLKYNNWGVSWTTMSYEDASAVVDSSFAQNYTAEELMQEVYALTSAVNALADNATFVELYDMYDYTDADGNKQNAIADVISTYGIDTTWDEMDSTTKSNVLVLATASSINAGNVDDVSAGRVISDFSMYTAFAAENEEFKIAYDNFKEAIANLNSDESEVDQIKTEWNKLRAAAAEANYGTWETSNGGNVDAFEAIMSGIGSAMDKNGDAILSDLGDPNMFTSGIGYDMYNDYLNAAYATAGLEFPEGINWEMLLSIASGEDIQGVYIYYSVNNGVIYIDNTMV